MSDKRDNGGPAFARSIGHGTVMVEGAVEMNLEVSPQAGMSLRDYFAAKALAGILANSDGRDNAEPTVSYVSNDEYPERCEWLARVSYRIADAMIAGRKK
jgi:hypothetical protein